MRTRALSPFILLLACARASTVPTPAATPEPPPSAAASALALEPLPCRVTVAREGHYLRDRYRFLAYDDAGRLVLAFTDFAGLPSDIETWRYSADGREAFKTRLSSSGRSETWHIVRDAQGRRVRVEIERDGNTAVVESVERDAHGRVVRHTSRSRESLTTWRADGRIDTEDGVRFEWSPTDPARATRVGPNGALDVVFVDDAHRVIRRIERFSANTGEPQTWKEYRWNHRDQIVEETRWKRTAPTGPATVVSIERRLYDRFGNDLVVDAPRFDCPRDGEVTFEQQDLQRLLSLEEDSDGGDLRISGRLERGLRQGLWSVFTRAGPKLREVEYRDGMPTRAVTFFPSGAPYEEGGFERWLRSGQWTRYWDDGKLREQGTFVGGRREGEFVQFAHDGSPLPSFHFAGGAPVCSPPPRGKDAAVDGVRCGRDGIVHVKEGLPFGRALGAFGAESESWSRPPVDVFSESHYLAGLLHGPATSWASSGRLSMSESYWVGKPHGAALMMAPDGTVQCGRERPVTRKSLGIGATPLDEKEQKALGVPAKRGLLVGLVFPGLPAERAGLRVGDALMAVNGAPLRALAQLAEAAQKGPVGLEVRRGTQRLDLTLEPVGPPALGQMASSGGDEVCPSARWRNAGGFNEAGDSLVQQLLRRPDFGEEPPSAEAAGALREQALACFRAAYSAPPAQRPAWACTNVASVLLQLGRFPEAHEQAWRCIEEAPDRIVAARAWRLLGSRIRGASLVSYLLAPTPAARMAINSDVGLPINASLTSLERRELPTGRADVPVVVIERMQRAEGAEEWLFLSEGGEVGLEEWATVLPMAVRRDGQCSAGRELEIVDGRVRIRSTSREGERGRACEARVAPEGEFPLEPFLSRPLSRFSNRRELPPEIERAWRQQLPRDYEVEASGVANAAEDLDLDGELDWFIRSGATIDVIEGGVAPTWRGRLFGREVTVRRDREQGFRALEVVEGAGPSAAEAKLYTFGGKDYVLRSEYRPEPEEQGR